MKVEISSFVERDLDAIADYIAEDNPARAVAFIGKIRAEFDAVGRNPQIYRLRPELSEGARTAIVGRYVILFRIIAPVVRIERVVYGERDLLTLFQQNP